MIAWMQTATIVFFATTPSRSMIVLAIEPWAGHRQEQPIYSQGAPAFSSSFDHSPASVVAFALPCTRSALNILSVSTTNRVAAFFTASNIIAFVHCSAVPSLKASQQHKQRMKCCRESWVLDNKSLPVCVSATWCVWLMAAWRGRFFKMKL
jgi:hypothetical protein